jgi:uncharacterized membrane protein
VRKYANGLIQPNLRTREQLHSRIVRAAKEHRVSLNREMNDRLEKSFDQDALRTIESVAADMQRIVKRMRDRS